MGRNRLYEELPPIFAMSTLQKHGFSKKQLRRRGMESGGYGVMQQRDKPPEQKQRILAIAETVEGSVISGISAAQYMNFRLPDRAQIDLQIYLHTLKSQRVRRKHITHLRSALNPHEYFMHEGHFFTSPARTFLDMGLYLTQDELILVADGLLACHRPRRSRDTTIIDGALLENYLREKRFHRGKATCLEALSLAKVGVDSVKETELRLLLSRFGIVDLVPNPVVRDEFNNYLFEPDLADFVHKISVQYEGAHHGTLRQMRLDDERRARTEAAGWVEVKIFVADLMNYVFFEGETVPVAVKKVWEAQRRQGLVNSCRLS